MIEPPMGYKCRPAIWPVKINYRIVTLGTVTRVRSATGTVPVSDAEVSSLDKVGAALLH